MKTMPRTHSCFMALLLLALVACDGQRAEAPDATRPSATPPASPAQVPPVSKETVKEAEDSGRYTSLGPSDCKIVEVDKEAGGSRSMCAGLGGYRLAVLEGDARMSVDVIAADGERQPLDLWTIASGAFSNLGPRAEWRFPQGSGTPSALILRFEAYEFPEQPERSKSYLVVAKLAAKGSCITALIEPRPGQNQLAREAADRAAGETCLKPRA